MSTLSATNRSRQKVLGYPVDIVDATRALKIVESAWQEGKRLQIVTLNAEMVVRAQQDHELDRIIRHAHLIIPDGAGVVWALRMSGLTVDRLPGIDLASAALQQATTLQQSVALVGGRPEILDRLKKNLLHMHPGMKIVAAHHGYFKEEEEERVVDEIAQAQPVLVLVALGVPKQEYFIDRWQSAFPKAVMIGVGGSFDIWAGTARRAPLVMQKFHLEWLFRLLSEPWRFKRIGSALPQFGLQVILDLLWKRNKSLKRQK